MSKIAALLTVTVALAASPDNSLRVIRSSRAGTTRSVMVVGAAAQDQIIRTAIVELGSANVTFGRMMFYPSEAASRVLFRENQTSCKPESLESFLQRNALPVDPPRCPQVAEVIKIGGSMLLRSVDAECRTSRKLIQGEADPLAISSVKERAEIVDIWAGVAPRSKETWRKEYPSIAVFVRANGAPNVELAKEILTRMQKKSGARDALVAVRNDSQFGKYCQFTQPYVFGEPDSFRSGEKKVGSGAVVCVSSYPHRVQCWNDHDSNP